MRFTSEGVVVPLWARNELAGGTRLGGNRGKRDEPVNAVCSLWDGRYLVDWCRQYGDEFSVPTT